MHVCQGAGTYVIHKPHALYDTSKEHKVLDTVEWCVHSRHSDRGRSHPDMLHSRSSEEMVDKLPACC